MLKDNPYGVTNGLNPTSYPVTPRLNQNAVNQAAADGLGNFRFQLDAQWIWRNQADNWTLWDWTPLDDAVSKLTAAGFWISYPLRGWPTWGLTNPSYQSTDEPHFMPDPSVVATFAQGVAQRYNGVYNIPTYGPMKIHRLEIGNEEYNISFTKSTLVYVLNQAVTAGNSYTTLAINAISPTFPTANTAGVPIAAGVHLQFGASGGSGETIKVTQATNNGDTLLHISNTSGGAFVPAQSYASGSNLTIVYYGLRTSPYAEYNGINGVLNNASPTPQPSRDPWFMQQSINTVAPAIRAVNANMKVGMGAIWWMWDNNFTDFIAGLGSALGLIDYMNLHFYSNALDPLSSSGHTPSITTALNNMKNAAVAAGYPNLHIWLTEFGYQVPDDCTEAQQATRYQEILDACRTSGFVDKVFCFTYDFSTNPVHSSLYTWNGSTFVPRQAVTNLKNAIVQYPLWSPVSVVFPTIKRRDGTFPQTLRRDGLLPQTLRRG